MRKTSLKPIWVSDIKPVSVNGHVHCWNVNVRFDGDLASWHNENPLPRSVEEFKRYMNWTDADIEKMEDSEGKSIERMFYEYKKGMGKAYEYNVSYLVNDNLPIPQRSNLSTLKWDEKSKIGDNKYANTLVGYVFLKGMFGFGHRRAKKFRDKMLAQIAEKNR